MNYKVIVQDEYSLLADHSGGNTRTTKDPVEIKITIEVEKKKYKVVLEKILKLLQKI